MMDCKSKYSVRTIRWKSYSYFNLGFNNKGPIIPPISTSTGSDFTLAIVSAWLKAHDKCTHAKIVHAGESSLAQEVVQLVDLSPESATSQAHGQRSKLPTRLIDVRSDKIQLRLSSYILIAGYGDRNIVDTRYLALSHCWGNSEFVTLTESNYQRFIYGEDVSALCQTFKMLPRLLESLVILISG